ncbi:hypothetical protein A2U01_0027379, partial [Trifolium medium]|nr:hypothetical protein [Trifolium medium]
ELDEVEEVFKFEYDEGGDGAGFELTNENVSTVRMVVAGCEVFAL